MSRCKAVRKNSYCGPNTMCPDGFTCASWKFDNPEGSCRCWDARVVPGNPLYKECPDCKTNNQRCNVCKRRCNQLFDNPIDIFNCVRNCPTCHPDDVPPPPPGQKPPNDCPDIRPACFVGDAMCCNKQWVCPDGVTGRYPLPCAQEDAPPTPPPGDDDGGGDKKGPPEWCIPVFNRGLCGKGRYCSGQENGMIHCVSRPKMGPDGKITYSECRCEQATDKEVIERGWKVCPTCQDSDKDDRKKCMEICDRPGNEANRRKCLEDCQKQFPGKDDGGSEDVPPPQTPPSAPPQQPPTGGTGGIPGGSPSGGTQGGTPGGIPGGSPSGGTQGGTPGGGAGGSPPGGAGGAPALRIDPQFFASLGGKTPGQRKVSPPSGGKNLFDSGILSSAKTGARPPFGVNLGPQRPPQSSYVTNLLKKRLQASAVPNLPAAGPNPLFQATRRV